MSFLKRNLFVLLLAGFCLWGAFSGIPAMAAVPAAGCSGAPVVPEEAVRKAVNRFAAGLLRLSAENKPGNLMISPVSVHLALTMAANGAEGSTKAAMLKRLAGEGLTLDRLNRGIRAWKTGVSRTGSKTILGIANSIWFDKQYRPAGTFLKKNADFFGADARSLDFRDRGAPGIVNAWVKTATRGTIDSILEEIRSDEVLFLVNAVYFKSDWQVPFEKSETRKEVFHAPGGDTETDFMHRTGRMTVFPLKGATGVSLPYEDGRFAFFALLPEGKTAPRAWLARQDPATLFEGIAQRMAKTPVQEVQLALPKFESRYEDTLEDELKKLGMGIAFDPARADFSAMSERRTKDLFIGTVRHKTFVRVDEKGTEASAVTSVGMRMTSLPAVQRKISFDRPFLYGIMDLKAGIPLFVGILENPANP